MVGGWSLVQASFQVCLPGTETEDPMIALRPRALTTSSARPRVTGLWPRFRVACAVMPLFVVASGVPATAQYIPDIGSVEGANIVSEEELDGAYDEARWRLGTLKIEPFLGLRDASVVSDQDPRSPDESETDFTATVGAGLRLYAKPSAKVTFAAHALPDYVWWQDNSDRSRLNLSLGAGLFAHLNRVQFEFSYRRKEDQLFFSSELPILQSSRRDLLKAAVEVEVSRGIKIFAVARDLDIEASDDDLPIFARIDRSEQRAALGVRIESRKGFWAEAAFEDAEIEFEPTARPLSNEGTTVGVGVGLNGDKLSGFVRVAFRDFEPADSRSVFTPFDDVTGGAELLWQMNRSLSWLAFATRGQSYALDESQSYFIADRQGLTARLRLGRGFLQLTGAVGEDDYESVFGGLDRVDDVEEASAQLSFPIRDLLVVSLTGRYTEYDSNLAGFDRDITAYGVNIRLGRLAEKLRLGRPDTEW